METVMLKANKLKLTQRRHVSQSSYRPKSDGDGGTFVHPFMDWYSFGQLLKTNTNLTELDISDNNLSEEDDLHISEGLRVNTTLTSLRLNRRLRFNYSIKHILKALEVNTTLQHLTVRQLRDVPKILNLLDKNTSLRTLDISDPGREMKETDLFHLSSQISKNTTLTKLTAKELRVNNAHLLLHALATNTTLTELDIEGARSLPEDESGQLTEIIKTNNSLTSLNVSVMGGLCVDWKTILQTNTTLKNLVLSDQSRYLNMRSFADGLATNTTLTALDISDNIYWIAVNYSPVIDALRVNTTLASLNLNIKQLEERDRLLSVLYIGENTTLTDLTVNANAAMGNHILEALQNNMSIKKIELDHNELREETPPEDYWNFQVINSLIKQNTTLEKLVIFGIDSEPLEDKDILEALMQNKTLTNVIIKRDREKMLFSDYEDLDETLLPLWLEENLKAMMLKLPEMNKNLIQLKMNWPDFLFFQKENLATFKALLKKKLKYNRRAPRRRDIMLGLLGSVRGIRRSLPPDVTRMIAELATE